MNEPKHPHHGGGVVEVLLPQVVNDEIVALFVVREVEHHRAVVPGRVEDVVVAVRVDVLVHGLGGADVSGMVGFELYAVAVQDVIVSIRT